MKKIIVAVMALLFGYSIAKADVVLVPDFRVDQDPTPNAVSDVASSIAYGYFVVAYTYMGVPAKCYARRFDLSGNALGNAFQVNPSSACSGATSTIDSNGNMVFVYPCFPSGLTHTCFRRFDTSDNPLDAGTTVDQASGTNGGGVIASLSGGGFIVAWQDDRSPGYSIYARIYNSSGIPIGNEFRVDQNPDVNNSYGASSMPVVASSGNRIYFSWVDARDGGNITFDANVYARVFDTSGNPIGNDFRVDQIPPFMGCYIGISMAAAPNGNFIVAWSDNRISGGDCMNTNTSFSRAMDSSGAFLAGEVNLVAGGDPEDLTCAPSGRCMLVYGGVWGRHLGSTGQLVDSAFKVDPNGGSWEPRVAPVGQNSFITTWTELVPDQVWANITGPDPSIPVLEFPTLLLLAFLLISFLLWRLRNKKIIATISLIILIFSIFSGRALATDCPGGPGYPCNETPPALIPANPPTLLHGNASKVSERRNIIFLSEGWTESQIVGSPDVTRLGCASSKRL